MNKLILAGILAMSGFVGAASVLPAQAADASSFCNGDPADISANDANIQQQLKAKGYDVTGTEEWNGCVRAFIVNANGTESMVLLDPDTLQPVVQTANV